jgi:hypothetical protein
MWMHFPLEFAFAFADRLAFWHSDLLVRLQKLRPLAQLFAGLNDGEMAAVEPRFGISRILKPRMRRYWELIGCTTKGASRSQFENGCGWWFNISRHPNCTDEQERQRRRRLYWDHGVGIRYWSKKYGGKVIGVAEADVAEGHCTQIGNTKYERVSPDNATRFLAKDLTHNFNLAKVCHNLALERFLVE